jgi:outer membrane phospholipase A
VKFQISFKYKLFGLGGGGEKAIARSLEFGYTQRSLWDINGNSSPFYDTSYMPELFVESLAAAPEKSNGWFTWLGYQAGFKHESNGRDGTVSRSLNTGFFRPMFAFGSLDRWSLIVLPEIYGYIGGLSDNSDLKDYRGYGKLRLILGRSDGLALMFTGLAGKDFNHETVQLDLTVPVRNKFLDLKTYFLIQYFNGYGESLLSYNKSSETVRAGLSFVR